MGAVEDSLYDFQEEEISAVRNRFPKLTLKNKGAWDGELDINAEYNGERITDTFTIGILASKKYPVELPVMIELGGRTEAIAQKYNLQDKRDLHYNIKSRVACLCVKQEEKNKFPSGSNLVTFIDNLVVPYLYGLSYYDKNGKWPWGEYGHGGLGLLEFYAEAPEPFTLEDIEETAATFRADDNWKEYSRQLRKPSSERFCICGSKRPFRKCHEKACQGVAKLHAEVKRLGLNPYKLYRRQTPVGS